MRIAVFLPDAAGGGAEKSLITVARALSAKGVPVDLVFADAMGPNLPEESASLRVINLGTHRRIQGILRLARYLRKEKPTAMLSGLTIPNLSAVLARMLAGVAFRLVVSEHSVLSYSFRQRSRLWQTVLLVCMRWAYRKADAIVAVSHFAARDLAKQLRFTEQRVSVIYNPIEYQRIRSLSREPLPTLWRQTISEAPLILSAGRLMPVKNHELLLRAFHELLKSQDAQLVILGEGPEREHLEAVIEELHIRDKVVLPGYMPNPYNWMHAADVFVLSSDWEGFGNVLAEARAVGTPIVSTNAPGGPSEILEHGRWGRLVPVGDFKSLAKALRESLLSPREPGTDQIQSLDIEVIVNEYHNLLTPVPMTDQTDSLH